MSLEIKIVADNTTALVAKLAEVAKSMTHCNDAPVAVDTMLDAINMQLPSGMECMIVDTTIDSKAKTEMAFDSKAKKKTPKKPEPSTVAEEVEEVLETVAEEKKGNTSFDEALDILAACYNDDDGKVAVKSLLRAHDVTRFSEIDKSHGDDLLKSATKIKVDCGI